MMNATIVRISSTHNNRLMRCQIADVRRFVVILVITRHSRQRILPPYCALSPRMLAIRNNWLYLATRSVRQSDPVLI